MKTIRSWVALVAIFFGLNVNNALATPKVVENGHTAGDSVARERHASPAADTSTVKADIKLIPFEGVPKANSAWTDLMVNAITTFRASGTLPSGTPTSVTDPRRIDHITPQSLMTWANGDGKTVWVLISATSKAGVDDVSLSMDAAQADSDDQGNHSLKQLVTFGNNIYTVLALGERADGTIITSGASSQLVKRVIVIVGFKSYNVTSAADVQEVNDYIVGDFSISMGVTVGASFSSITLGLLPPPPVARPGLAVVWFEGKPYIDVELVPGNVGPFTMQIGDNIGGPYQDWKSNVSGGKSYPIMDVVNNNPKSFFRLKSLP